MRNAEETMHELGIAQSAVEVVLETARSHGGRALSVRMQVGALRAIEPEVMRFCWEAASRGTAVEGAALEIERIAATGRCRDCGERFEAEELVFLCPECGGADVETVHGMELMVASVELE